MGARETRPVNMLMVSAAASIVMAGVAVFQHFVPLTFTCLCRTWLLLPLVLG